jgi:hypothetical protein
MKRLALLLGILPILTGTVSLVHAQTPVVTVATQSATGASASYDAGAYMPRTHTLVIIPTGGPATCTLQMQYSLDNANWFSLGAAQTCTSAISVVVIDIPTRYVRANLTALTGGSSPTVKTLYLGVK